MPEIPDQHGELTDRTPVLQAIVGELAKKLTALQDDAAARFALVMNEWAAESNRAKTAAIESAYRAGREDAARDERAKVVEEIARAIERANDAGDWPGVSSHRPAILAYRHAAFLARYYRVPDCGHEYHGADGGPCPRCGFDVTESDQPRTLHGSGEVQDNPGAQR